MRYAAVLAKRSGQSGRCGGVIAEKGPSNAGTKDDAKFQPRRGTREAEVVHVAEGRLLGGDQHVEGEELAGRELVSRVLQEASGTLTRELARQRGASVAIQAAARRRAARWAVLVRRSDVQSSASSDEPEWLREASTLLVEQTTSHEGLAWAVDPKPQQTEVRSRHSGGKQQRKWRRLQNGGDTQVEAGREWGRQEGASAEERAFAESVKLASEQRFRGMHQEVRDVCEALRQSREAATAADPTGSNWREQLEDQLDVLRSVYADRRALN